MTSSRSMRMKFGLKRRPFPVAWHMRSRATNLSLNRRWKRPGQISVLDRLSCSESTALLSFVRLSNTLWRRVFSLGFRRFSATLQSGGSVTCNIYGSILSLGDFRYHQKSLAIRGGHMLTSGVRQFKIVAARYPNHTVSHRFSQKLALRPPRRFLRVCAGYYGIHRCPDVSISGVEYIKVGGRSVFAWQTRSG